MARTSRRQQTAQHRQPSCAEQSGCYHTAIYVRFSVEDNGKDADSIESQIAYLENFIAGNPTMRKAAVFVDNGCTGTDFMRPGFRRMIDAARAGEISCVVVKDPSVIIGAKIRRPEHTDPSLILSSFTISGSRPPKAASLMPQRNPSPKNPPVGADAFRKYLPAIPGRNLY